MSRLLFLAWDGGGNVPPTIGLASQLAARGHDVRILGNADSRSLQGRALAAGARFVPFRSVPRYDRRAGSFEDQMPWFVAVTCGPAAGNDLRTELAREPADALVIDCMAFGALAEAERCRVPCVSLVHLLYQGMIEGPWGEIWTSALPFINETRAELGLAPRESRRQLLDGAGLVLVTSPREFDAPMAHRPDNVRYVGPIFERLPDEDGFDLPWPPENREPLVLVSFSSTYQHQEALLQRVLDGIADSPVRALVTLGDSIGPDELTAPGNAAIRPWVPHAAILPHASLVVTHAGHATVMAALAHGVPMVCVPMGRDQHATAARVEATGSGKIVSSDAEPGEVPRAVEHVLGTPSYRRAARRLAAIIERHAEEQTALVEVEAFVSGGRPLRLSDATSAGRDRDT